MKSEAMAVFDENLETIARVSSVNLTVLMYGATALQFFGLSFSNYKFAIFSSILTVIPICSAWVVLGRQGQSPDTSLAILASKANIAVSAYLLAGAAITVWLFGLPITTWTFLLRLVVTGLTFLHLAIVLTGVLLAPFARARLASLLRRTMVLRGVSSAPLSFILIVSWAMLILFRVEPGNPFLNVLFGFAGGFSPKPGSANVILSSLLALLAIAGCFRLIRFELERHAERPFPSQIQHMALIAVVPAVFYFYFDYTLDSDILHFLTNVGPAAQIINAGSVPMVSAFSQYGPGPMMLTWLTFLITSPSFHASNILSQLHSLAFYSVILLCLVRMTPYRLPALLLGFLAIGVVLAGWWGGNGNLNSVPSSMGMRYLPNGLLVLAVSLLPEGRKFSIALFLSVVLAALWSFETLLGSIAILGLFLLISAVRDRDPTGFARAVVVAIVFPIATAVFLTSALTLFWAGKLPDYPTYLNFARVYNMTSEFWALDGSGAFLGWIPVAAAVMIGLTLAWLAAIDPKSSILQCKSQIIIYRFAPMAALTGFMSSYYAGRSVDFTLIISFLPLSALIIPVILVVFRESMSLRLPRMQLAALPVLVVFLALTFSFSALYRKNAPYSTAISECFYDHVCSPFGLAEVARFRYSLRPMLDQAANPGYFDTSGMAAEALDLIKRYASNRLKIAIFLGIHPTTIWSVHTNTVLVLANNGHRWPISYVLSDELNPPLQRAIVNADVHLEEGEPVFVRSDESRLGPLESAILKKIRSSARLCPLPGIGPMVTAFRVTLLQQCD